MWKKIQLSIMVRTTKMYVTQHYLYRIRKSLKKLTRVLLVLVAMKSHLITFLKLDDSECSFYSASPNKAFTFHGQNYLSELYCKSTMVTTLIMSSFSNNYSGYELFLSRLATKVRFWTAFFAVEVQVSSKYLQISSLVLSLFFASPGHSTVKEQKGGKSKT